ncbi:WRKY transcription factor 28-like [Cryptomeria japonica]|uniref:WRKY transcription factor 28-like n=1 Tax=Cryptomeria japonica TaxID=3369 RepID=UPI0027D9E61E|nr:WRKY transcription factor 28-like [Cryptomeria japonica]
MAATRFSDEKAVGYEGCEIFEQHESGESHSFSNFKRLRSRDEDGIYEFQSKRMKNVEEKSSQTQKVIIQVKSGELLDDGYKWRKCYYKCSDKKCGVKKLVERKPFEDETLVITYE